MLYVVFQELLLNTTAKLVSIVPVRVTIKIYSILTIKYIKKMSDQKVTYWSSAIARG